MSTGNHLLIVKNTAKTFDADNLPILDPLTQRKPTDLGNTYENLCLAADGLAQVFPEHKVSLGHSLISSFFVFDVATRRISNFFSHFQ